MTLNGPVKSKPFSARCSDNSHSSCSGKVGRWVWTTCQCHCHGLTNLTLNDVFEEEEENPSPLVWDGNTKYSEPETKQYSIHCVMCGREYVVDQKPQRRPSCTYCGSGFTVVGEPEVGHHERVYEWVGGGGDMMSQPKPITPYVWWEDLKKQERRESNSG